MIKLIIIIALMFALVFSASLLLSSESGENSDSESIQTSSAPIYWSSDFALEDGKEFTKILTMAKVENGDPSLDPMIADAYIRVTNSMGKNVFSKSRAENPVYYYDSRSKMVPAGYTSCHFELMVDIRNNTGWALAFAGWSWQRFD